MNVIEIKSLTVKTYTVTVEDGEVRDQPYASTARRYRVRKITVTKRDGNVDSVEVSGSVLKKDGSESLNGATERFYSHRDWPEWLRSIVGGLA